MAFVAVKGEDGADKLFLYASTKRGLTSFDCSEEATDGKPHHTVVLDERGVAPHCATVNEEGEIAVGQSDAVYFYTPQDRGGCFGFEGEKKYICYFKHYLLVAHVDPRGRHAINVYDLKNKFIACNWTLTSTMNKSTKREGGTSSEDKEEIRYVVSEFGSIFVVSSHGHIYRLSEKDTASKLELLYRKNLYAIAISLAFSAHYDINNIVDIFRMYGDHLYDKGDFDGSIKQYSRTIGHVEPSYVIQRFLDAQRITYLTAYLEALHNKGFANSEHTTLLLNCYTKLKDVTKLDHFIYPERETGKTSTGTDITPLVTATLYSLTFDVETAISVLRNNYPQHALSLARRHKEHSWYLKIQLEHISYVDIDEILKEADKNRILDALEYIKCLPFAEAEGNLKKYGRSLVTHLPNETTELLKLLCTGRYIPQRDTTTTRTTTPDASAPETPKRSDEDDKKVYSDPADFVHLYVAHPQFLRQFMEYIVAEAPSRASKRIGNTLLELLIQEQTTADTETDDGNPSSGREDAVMKMLDNPQVMYDADHALILVQMHGMKRGQRYLYGKLHMYQHLLQLHMETKDDIRVIEEVKKHGEQDPNLWLMALKYFSKRAVESQGDYSPLTQVLKLVHKNPNIPTLQVVQVLSHAKKLPLRVIREFIISRLKADQAKINEDQNEINKFKMDTDKMRNDITTLTKKAIVFKSKKCDLCSHSLDSPTVHFKCLHSYHGSCMSEVDLECHICASEHRHVISLKASLEHKPTNHELFFNQVFIYFEPLNCI